MKQQLGKKLKEWRKRRNFTQEDLAGVADLSVDAISMIERGINFPSRETLEKMSKALNIPIKDFLEIINEDVNTSERQKTLDKILGILHKLDDKKLQMALKHIEVLVD